MNEVMEIKQGPTGKFSRTSSRRAGRHEDRGNVNEGVCVVPQREMEGTQEGNRDIQVDTNHSGQCLPNTVDP